MSNAKASPGSPARTPAQIEVNGGSGAIFEPAGVRLRSSPLAPNGLATTSTACG